MRAEVPDLWAKADYFSAHTYPFHGQPFSNPLGRAGIENYRAQLKAIGGASTASSPVAISETGWSAADEQVKATNMVEAYREVYLPDPTVFAVMPFLLTGPTLSNRHSEDLRFRTRTLSRPTWLSAKASRLQRARCPVFGTEYRHVTGCKSSWIVKITSR
jgi:hypothetical protein